MNESFIDARDPAPQRLRNQSSKIAKFTPGWKAALFLIAVAATYINVKQLLVLNAIRDDGGARDTPLAAAHHSDESASQDAAVGQWDRSSSIVRQTVRQSRDALERRGAGISTPNSDKADFVTDERGGGGSSGSGAILGKETGGSPKAKHFVAEAAMCHAQPHTEYLGAVLLWGAGNHQDSAGGCCEQCRSQEKCNSWVWCAHVSGCGGERRHRECWLKSQSPFHPHQPQVAARGPGVRWTSGLVYDERQVAAAREAAAAAEAADVARLAGLRDNLSLPLVFLDVSIGAVAVGRMVFVLFTEESPLQSENMRQLCTGERGLVPKDGSGRRGEGLPYHLQGRPFYRIIDRFIDQTGVDTESIYGGQFQDDPGGLALRHDRKGLLSAANSGPDSNTCHFSILMAPAPHLDGHYTIFGELVEGWHIAQKINALSQGKPNNAAGAEAGAVISSSGQLRAGSPAALPPFYRARLALPTVSE